jgi:hypothetical protein
MFVVVDNITACQLILWWEAGVPDEALKKCGDDTLITIYTNKRRAQFFQANYSPWW